MSHDDTGSAMSDEPSTSLELGVSSTPELCEEGKTHTWVCFSITHGWPIGLDEHGDPIFVVDPEQEPHMAYGCAVCDTPWNASLLKPQSC